MQKTRISEKGQVVIPKNIRDKLGLSKGVILKIGIEGRKVTLEPAEEPPEDIFIEAGPSTTEPLLKEAKKKGDKAEHLLEVLSEAP